MNMDITEGKVVQISTASWTIEKVLDHGANFYPIERVKARSLDDVQEAIERFEEDGLPVIIEGWHQREDWPADMFTLDFFQQHSPEDISVRNVHDWKDSKMPLKEFISKSREAAHIAPASEQVRMYGKDAECPEAWSAWIKDAKVVPESLHWNGSNDYFRYRPKNARVETLMCYLGIGDTFTPAHKDLCASSGHNLMCYTENGGSSYWFMTKSSDAEAASQFFQNLNQELDHEAHVITLNELANAPFNIYVAEQSLGDLVLVPPRSCHQVVNFGGVTLKTSWSRMTLKGLLTAYYHELPIYQRVCRFETYRVKSTIFCALRKQTKELQEMHPLRGTGNSSMVNRVFKGRANSRVHTMIESLNTLLAVFREIVVQEYSKEEWESIYSTLEELNDEQTMEHRIVCDFCGCDIFQAFFECNTCGGAPEGSDEISAAYTICPACYVDGRSCKCIVMQPKQCFPNGELSRAVKEASQVLQDYDRDWSKEPLIARYSTFKAACILHAHRKRTYCCFFDKEETYGLSCARCHNSKCFKHLLDRSRLHAVEALSIHESSGQDHSEYHRAHQEGKQRYADSASVISESQRKGTKGPIDMLRVHYALKYRTCRPWCVERSKEGFYDAYIQDCGEDTPQDMTPSTITPRSSTLSLSTIQPENASQVSIPTSTEARSDSPSSRPRMILDYVAVPKAPYSIKPQSKSISFTNTSEALNPIPQVGRTNVAKRKRQDTAPGTTEPSRSPSLEPATNDDRTKITKPIRKRKRLDDLRTGRPSTSASTRVTQARQPDVEVEIATPAMLSASTSASGSELTSTPGKKHRFKSGMVVVLKGHSDFMDRPFVSDTSSHSPPNPTTPIPRKRVERRKEKDPGVSLADALNQAIAHNSRPPSIIRTYSRNDRPAVPGPSQLRKVSTLKFSRITNEVQTPPANSANDSGKSTSLAASDAAMLRSHIADVLEVIERKEGDRRVAMTDPNDQLSNSATDDGDDLKQKLTSLSISFASSPPEMRQELLSHLKTEVEKVATQSPSKPSQLPPRPPSIAYASSYEHESHLRPYPDERAYYYHHRGPDLRPKSNSFHGSSTNMDYRGYAEFGLRTQSDNALGTRSVLPSGHYEHDYDPRWPPRTPPRMHDRVIFERPGSDPPRRYRDDDYEPYYPRYQRRQRSPPYAHPPPSLRRRSYSGPSYRMGNDSRQSYSSCNRPRPMGKNRRANGRHFRQNNEPQKRDGPPSPPRSLSENLQREVIRTRYGTDKVYGDRTGAEKDLAYVSKDNLKAPIQPTAVESSALPLALNESSAPVEEIPLPKTQANAGEPSRTSFDDQHSDEQAWEDNYVREESTSRPGTPPTSWCTLPSTAQLVEPPPASPMTHFPEESNPWR